MLRGTWWALVFAVFASAAGLAAQATGGGLELISSDGRTRVLSAADLGALPRTELTANDGMSTATFAGPTLRDLLTLMGAPAGRALRGPAMSLVVLAEAADGYTVAFTVAELDPQFGDRAAIVAMRRDAAPLAEGDGPLRIVVPEDDFHARWVRQLVRLRIVQLPSGAAAQPHG